MPIQTKAIPMPHHHTPRSRARHLLHAAACAAALLAAPAFAQNLYAELGAGSSRASADCSGTSSCDRNGSFVRGIVGYQLTPHWAVELALADMGRIRATAPLPGVGSVQITAKLRSAGLGAAGTWPVTDKLSFTGRLGVASNQTSISGESAGTAVSDSERNTALYAGLALHHAVSSTMSVGLTLDRTQAEYGGDQVAVAALGLGLRLLF